MSNDSPLNYPLFGATPETSVNLVRVTVSWACILNIGVLIHSTFILLAQNNSYVCVCVCYCVQATPTPCAYLAAVSYTHVDPVTLRTCMYEPL